MSNTYYKYRKTQKDKDSVPGNTVVTDMELSLTACVGDSPNTLQLTVDHNVRGINSACGAGYITLTQQEQDDLICGILERRGVDPGAFREWVAPHSRESGRGISATGYEQSNVHPAEQ